MVDSAGGMGSVGALGAKQVSCTAVVHPTSILQSRLARMDDCKLEKKKLLARKSGLSFTLFNAFRCSGVQATAIVKDHVTERRWKKTALALFE